MIPETMQKVAKMYEQTIAQLKKDEGFSSVVYTDTRGVKTFGIGFTYITESEADIILAGRVQEIAKQLFGEFSPFKNLDPVRQSVLIQMAYNLGFHGLSEFRVMLACLAEGDYQGAAKAMLASLWAKEVGNRAERLALAMESGKMP